MRIKSAILIIALCAWFGTTAQNIAIGERAPRVKSFKYAIEEGQFLYMGFVHSPSRPCEISAPKISELINSFDHVAFSEPVADKMWYASAGIGFRVSEVTSIDLAYQYRNTHYSDYYSFYTKWSDIPNESPKYGLDLLNHNISLAFAFRF